MAVEAMGAVRWRLPLRSRTSVGLSPRARAPGGATPLGGGRMRSPERGTGGEPVGQKWRRSDGRSRWGWRRSHRKEQGGVSGSEQADDRGRGDSAKYLRAAVRNRAGRLGNIQTGGSESRAQAGSTGRRRARQSAGTEPQPPRAGDVVIGAGGAAGVGYKSAEQWAKRWGGPRSGRCGAPGGAASTTLSSTSG